jgi:hypothetical protein
MDSAPRYWEEKAEELSRTGLSTIQTRAAAWAGTTATLLGLFGTVAIVAGSDTISDFTSGVQFTIIVLTVAALLCAFYAVVATALAAQGVPRKFKPLTGKSLAKWHVEESDLAADRLQSGRGATVLAAVLIVIAGIVAMVATALKPDSGVAALIRTDRGAVECGYLSRNNGDLILRDVEGDQLLILDRGIAAATIVSVCP